MLHVMEFYGAESGLPIGAIWAKDNVLPINDPNFDADVELEQQGGTLSNKVSYTADIGYIDAENAYDSDSNMPDIRIIGEGTHPRGGVARVEGTFQYEPPFMLPEVALWVGGTLTGNPNANAEGGPEYDIMVDGEPEDYVNYDGTGDIAPMAQDIWLASWLSSSGESYVEGSTHGDPDNPTLVVVNGDLNTSGASTTGYGVLYITGSLTINGNLNWHGAVIVAGTITDYHGGGGNNCSDSDDNSIHGSLISLNNVNMQNGDVCYDDEHILKFKDKYSRYVLRSWRQL